MNTFSDRILAQRKKLNLTQSDVAKKIGIARVSYTQWELGETNPKGENLLKLATVLQCSPGWIMSGKGHTDDMESNVELAPRLKGMIPVINEVQAGIWSDIKDSFLESDAIEWISTTRTFSKFAFALRVVGDSMFCHGNPKSLSEGQIVIIDPESTPSHRDVVVAMLGNTDKATVKQLLIDGNDRILNPLNERYKPIPVTEDVNIVGVVMDAITRFK